MLPFAWLGLLGSCACWHPTWTPGPESVPGAPVIAGGATLPPEVEAEFFRLAGGPGQAKIVVVPTASADADDPTQAASFTRRWQARQPAWVRLWHTRDRARANDPLFVALLREATAIWFSGGDQRRVSEAYRDTLAHQEMMALLYTRRGVIGGTSAGAAIQSDPMITGGSAQPILGPGLGFLPGVLCDQHFLARQRQPRLRQALEQLPDRVGLGIDESTAVVIQGRRLKVLGQSKVVVILPPARGEPGLPLQETELASGAEADWWQLRRAAWARSRRLAEALQKPPVPRVPQGSLLLVGGGELPKSLLEHFIAQAGGNDAPIVFIPTASETEPDQRIPIDFKLLQATGAKNLTMLHTRDRLAANEPSFVEPLGKARGVWFSGGRQWRLIDAYAGTATEAAFWQVLARGGIIGGTSAGASIQSQFMPRGHPLGNRIIQAEGYELGLGFLPGCAVDQHFFAQNRPPDMTLLMKTYPKLLGIGLDEGTALWIRGSRAEVLGLRSVAIYDGFRLEPESRIDYRRLKPGMAYDLVERQLLPR